MKVLIAYYSHSGTTRKIAEQIKNATDSDLFEIRCESPYPTDYTACTKQAKRDIAEGFKPKLKGEIPDASGYDTILVGSPNWWSTIATPVTSFLSTIDTTGKVIAPFITHGGGGLNNTVRDIRKLCPNAEVLDGFDANRSNQLAEWINKLNIR